MRIKTFLALFLLAFLLLVHAAAQQTQQPVKETVPSFQKREELIRMRDGVRLYTVIFTPSNQTENLPIIIQRTPYGISGITSDGIGRELAADGYIFVYQDIRG